MGSNSWHDNILQALVIGLIVQIAAYMLCVLWASLKERMARSATDESMAESDLEMGTVNVGEDATILVNSGVGDDGKLEHTKDVAYTRANTSEAQSPTPKAQCKNVTEDVNSRASACGGGCFTQSASGGGCWKESLNSKKIPVAANGLPNTKYS